VRFNLERGRRFREEERPGIVRKTLGREVLAYWQELQRKFGLKAIFVKGPKERRVSLKDISPNSKLRQRFQVRGVVYCMFNSFLNGYIPLCKDCINFPLFDVVMHCSIEVSGFFQKPPGGSTQTLVLFLILA